jgi:hypothetical protein
MLLHSVQNGFVAHQESYSTGTGCDLPGRKRAGRVADHSPPFIAEVKNSGTIPPLHHTFSWHSTKLIKHRDNFTFYIYLVKKIKKCSSLIVNDLIKFCLYQAYVCVCVCVRARGHIHNVPVGKVNILGGHSISHSKQNFVCTYVLLRKVSEIEIIHFIIVWIWRPILSFRPDVLRHCVKRQLAVVTVDSDIVGVLWKRPHISTIAECADMLYPYGFCDCSAVAAVEECRGRFPMRRIPDRRVFTKVFNKIRESGTLPSVQVSSERARKQHVEEQEHILEMVQHGSTTSTRKLSTHLGVSRTRV